MSGRGRAISAVMAVAAVLAAASAGDAQPASQPALAAAGAATFQTGVGCANCHFKDSTDTPPLEGVAGRNIAT